MVVQNNRWGRLKNAWQKPPMPTITEEGLFGKDLQQIGAGLGGYQNAFSAFQGGWNSTLNSGLRSAFGFTTPSQEEARTIAAYYACISLIARMISQMPLRFIDMNTKDKDEVLQRIAFLWNNKARGQLFSGPRLTNWVVRQILEYGNSYVEMVVNSFEMPIALNPIHAGRVTTRVKTMVGSNEFPMYHQIYRDIYSDGGLGNKDRDIDGGRMLHFMGEEHIGGVYGMPLLSGALRNIISLGLEEETFVGERFSLSPMGELLIKTNLGMAQVEELSKRLSERNYGREGSGKPIVAPEGAEITPMSLNVSENMLLTPREWTAEEICRVLAVPPVMIGMQSRAATYAVNYREQRRAFTANRLQPMVKDMSNEIESKILPENTGVVAEFDAKGHLDLSRAELADIHSTETGGSATLLVNEARKEKGLGEVEGGDKLPNGGSTEEFRFRKEEKGKS